MTVAVATTYVFRRSHDWILQFLEVLTEEQLHWVEGLGVPSIAFHAWHTARWADLLQSCLPGMTAAPEKQPEAQPQIWERDSLAPAWGLPSKLLGSDSTGMGMDDEIAAGLSLPSKDELLRYVREAFAGAVEAGAGAEDD